MAHYLLRFEGLFLGLVVCAKLRRGAAGGRRAAKSTCSVDGRDGALRRRRALPVALLEREFVEKEGPRLAAGGFGGARRFGGAASWPARVLSCKFIVMYIN